MSLGSHNIKISEASQKGEIFSIDDVSVMTKDGVMSGDLIFIIRNKELLCQYSYADDSETFIPVEKSDDYSFVSTEDEVRGIVDAWRNDDGSKPRDEDGNVIALSY